MASSSAERGRPAKRKRFAFCGTFPGVAPAGRYPAPCFRGARTFLHRKRASTANGHSARSQQRPSGQLAPIIWRSGPAFVKQPFLRPRFECEHRSRKVKQPSASLRGKPRDELE
jgi:hypothetical protein